MQNENENNNAAITAAVNKFADAAFVLLNRLDGDALTPAAHGARLLLQSEVDFKVMRDGMCAALREIESALDALKTTPAPAAPVVDPTPTPETAAPVAGVDAAPVAGVDAATVAALVREQVLALAKAEFALLDLRKVAGEAALAAFEAADLDYEGLVTNNVDLDDVARDAINNIDLDDVARDVLNDAVENLDLEDLARDIIKEQVDGDFTVDADECAREVIEEKIDNDLSLDVDDVAREIVEQKINDDLDVERAAEKVIRDLLDNKPLTITLKG